MVDAPFIPRTGRAFFERGIDGITDAPGAGGQPRLPDTKLLAPAALVHQTALDELLGARNLDTLLEAACRPDVAGRELLAPQRFYAVMEQVAAHFARTANARRHANPRVGRLLDSAGRLLAEEAELRELLQYYRNALVQG